MKDLAGRILRRSPALLALFIGIDASAATETKRNPVLLIHGLSRSAASMELMKRRLSRAGWNVFAIDLRPSNGSARLEELAKQIDVYVRQTFPVDQEIDIVAFSMGGVVSRYYLQRLGGARRVGRFVCLSAPNHGSWLAYLSRRPGCMQMRPTSAFLASLNRDLTPLGRVKFMSIWTPLDLMILPPSSSRMPIGKQRTVWMLAHPLMIFPGPSLRAVEEFLSDADYCGISGVEPPRLNISM